MNLFTSKKHFYMAGYLLLIGFLHVNAILKAEDPIADTQTEAISYDQKMEQDKDGVKAPATPKMIYYGGQGFLTRSSLSKYENEIASASKGKKKEKFNWSDWWEDKPSETQTDTAEIKPAETVEPEILQGTDLPAAKDSSLDSQQTDIKEKKTDEKPAGSAQTVLEEESFPGEESAAPDQSQPPAGGNTKGDDWW